MLLSVFQNLADFLFICPKVETFNKIFRINLFFSPLNFFFPLKSFRYFFITHQVIFFCYKLCSAIFVTVKIDFSDLNPPLSQQNLECDICNIEIS